MIPDLEAISVCIYTYICNVIETEGVVYKMSRCNFLDERENMSPKFDTLRIKRINLYC